LKLANKEYYKGEWKDGEKTGKGLYYFKNLDYYEGYWKKNKRTGYGI